MHSAARRTRHGRRGRPPRVAAGLESRSRVGAHHSMMVKGQRALQNLFAPAAGAGLGGFLGSSQKSRAYSLEMVKFTAETKPPLDFYAETHYPDLDAIYSYLRHWA